MTEFETARRNMVDCQLRPNKVVNAAILEAMEAAPRELFLTKALRGIAYADDDIGLGDGRYLMEPLVLARLLQSAEIKPSDVVLNIGCGPGYDAAVIGRLAATVVAVEQDSNLVELATKTLNDLDADNVAVVQGDLTAGWPGQGPYDVIVISGSVGAVPATLTDQLADGGRLVAVVGNPRGMGWATLFVRHGDKVASRAIFDAGTPTLPGFVEEPGFVF